MEVKIEGEARSWVKTRFRSGLDWGTSTDEEGGQPHSCGNHVAEVWGNECFAEWNTGVADVANKGNRTSNVDQYVDDMFFNSMSL